MPDLIGRYASKNVRRDIRGGTFYYDQYCLQNFIRNNIYDKDVDKASEMTTQFIIDFASWYRDSDGDSISRSSIYEYIKKNTLGISLVKKDFCAEDLKREIILSSEILKAFFINNDVNSFPDKFGNLKDIVIDFHSYIQQVLAD